VGLSQMLQTDLRNLCFQPRDGQFRFSFPFVS